MEKQILKRFTMNVDHTNPDAKVTFTSVGTGKTQKEAVIFALGMFYRIMSGHEAEEGDEINNYEDSLEIVNNHLADIENIDTVVNSLIEGTIEKNSDIFYNSYEDTEVDYEFSEIENVSEGGYISKLVVIEPEY